MSAPAQARLAPNGDHPSRDDDLEDAVETHIRDMPEPFTPQTIPEILAAPTWTAGECVFPDCARRFCPTRAWQVYCCDDCRRADSREWRAWGHRAAPALLAWRMFKYDPDPARRALVRRARRYVTEVQSAWAASRAARAAAGRERWGQCS